MKTHPQWAMNNNVPDVVGYLSFSKAIFDFDPAVQFATPQLDFVSEMIGADGFESADAFEQKD